MALSNAQLLMLDTLIYANNVDTNTSYVSDGATVREIVTAIENDGYNINACEMTSSEWQELIAMIKDEPVLLDYTVTNCVDDNKTGMRAACFVNNEKTPTDVNIVFRGTSGEYEWHDNGEGGYLQDTDQQKLAADYVSNLPEKYGNYMTVTGHSKGGNKAQYVTIVTDRIAKCVSFDGQGFSEEFLEKYKPDIEKKAQSIVSISASDDYVNCLLYPIAGTRIYIDTEGQDNFLHYHKPNILFDQNGNLRPQTEQSDLPKFINEYTTYMISNLGEPERSTIVDGIINVVIGALSEDSNDLKEAMIKNIYAEANAISHLDDFVFNYIGEKYGFPAELAVTYLAAVVCPYLFLDDLIHSGQEMLGSILSGMYNFAQDINSKLKSFGEKAAGFGKKFVSAISNFSNNIAESFNKKFNTGYKASIENPQICVDTAKLRAYADRLRVANKRLNDLDQRMDSLYLQVGLRDLFNLLQADLITGSSGRISNCIKYLDETANDFDTTERNVAELF